MRALVRGMLCVLGLMLPGLRAQARDPLTGSIAETYVDGSDSMPYRVFRPTGYDTPNTSFPLVVFLHGNGERGTNNTSQVTSHTQGLIDRTESGSTAAYLLAPQAPAGGQTLQWTNIAYPVGSYANPTLNAPAITNPLRLALDLVEQFAALHNVDRSRIYITGLSMGGYGTWDAIARRPGLFAAAVPLSGGGNISVAGTYAGVPIWAFHGALDTTVPTSGSRNTIAAIENAGGTRERYTELSGQGHNIWAPIYNGGTFSYDTNFTGTYATEGSGDMYSWMFAQSIPEPGTASLLALGVVILGRRRRH